MSRDKEESEVVSKIIFSKQLVQLFSGITGCFNNDACTKEVVK